MRIGIMLRHYEQHEGGVKVYTQNLLPRLLSIGSEHHYVLMYQNPDLLGTYANVPCVEEIALPIPGKILWDQVAVPWIAKRKNLDVIFNLKFTVPFFTKVKKVFVLHGSEWFVIPGTFLWYDRWYFRLFLPFYCRRADAIIAVSHTVKQDIVRHIGVCLEKVTTVHNGFNPDVFHPIRDSNRLQSVREKYALPKRFILWVGQIYPPKNFGRLVQAFAEIMDKIPHDLVIAGEERWRAKAELQWIQKLGLERRVRFIGWIAHADLSVLYNLAELFVFPSLYEGFGIPLLEAMAAGCPVLTSKSGSPPEVTDGAAYLVDPLQVDEIGKGICEILSNVQLRELMVKKGFERVNSFSWEKCARETLAVLDSVHASAKQ
jgi:glycosyltransferase involved in cell wall biosynthesis